MLVRTMPQTKEFKTIEQQIAGLKVRKLKFKNEKKAFKILQKYNYFDIINGFESILIEPGVTPKTYNNVYFEDFYDLYKFDMELKKQILYKVFDVESRLRTSISYHFASTYCTTIQTTMNYTNRNCYQAPTGNVHLSNVFANFDLFAPTFINSLKHEKEYVNRYTYPPFWVVIKSLPLGSLYYTYLFLDNAVKPLVLDDFGFNFSQSKIFEQSIYVLKELRNQCAHLELITRFRLKRKANLNNFNDLTIYSGLSRTPLTFIDATKILKIFGGASDLKWIVFKFYIKMCIKGRKKIANKVLGKMGRKNIYSWIKI